MTTTGAPEGVQQFTVGHVAAPLEHPDLLRLADELDQIRAVVRARGWLGQDPSRYDGYGYGNLSGRASSAPAAPGERVFLVSGSQTGQHASIAPWGYAVVARYQIERNHVDSRGPAMPSSEALTHGALYDADARFLFALHLHDPGLFRRAAERGLPATPDSALNGTVDLARAILELGRAGALERPRALYMRGHLDGLLTFGETAEEALRAALDLAD